MSFFVGEMALVDTCKMAWLQGCLYILLIYTYITYILFCECFTVYSHDLCSEFSYKRAYKQLMAPQLLWTSQCCQDSHTASLLTCVGTVFLFTTTKTHLLHKVNHTHTANSEVTLLDLCHIICTCVSKVDEKGMFHIYESKILRLTALHVESVFTIWQFQSEIHWNFPTSKAIQIFFIGSRS